MVNTFAVGKANADTGATTQDLTISGFGTPDYVMVFVTATTSDGADTVNENFSWGHTDLTNEWCMGIQNEGGGLAVMATSKNGCVARLIQLATLADPSAPVVSDFAVFGAGITDGIRIDWNGGSAPGSAWRMTYLFMKGGDLIVEVGTTTASAGEDTTTTVSLGAAFSGIEPELLICGANGGDTWDNTYVSEAIFSIGFCHNDGAERQVTQAWGRENNATKQDCAQYISSVGAAQPYVVRNPSPGPALYPNLEVTSFANQEFVITTRDQSGKQIMGYVALSWGGNVDIHLEDWAADFNTGSKSTTFVGFAFELMFGTMGFLPNTNRDANRVGNTNAPGVFVMTDDGITSHQQAWWADDNSNNSSGEQRYDGDWVRVTTETGNIGIADPVLDSIDATGFTYTPTTTNTAVKCGNMVFLADKPPATGRRRAHAA